MQTLCGILYKIDIFLLFMIIDTPCMYRVRLSYRRRDSVCMGSLNHSTYGQSMKADMLWNLSLPLEHSWQICRLWDP